MSAVLVAILVKVAPAVVGPVVTWAVKWLMARFESKLPSIAKVAISAAAGAVTAVTTGDTTAVVDVAGEIVTGGLMGAGGSKARDVLTGNVDVVTKEEKVNCGSLKPTMPWEG